MSLKTGKQIIQTEINALKELLSNLDDSFEKTVTLLGRCNGKIIVTGVGKSGIVGQKIAATLSSTGSRAVFLHASEAVHGDLGIIAENDVAIVISYSGETAEVLNVLAPIKRRGIPVVSITGSPESTLAKKGDVHLDIMVRKESDPLGLAPTSSKTATLVLGDALAIALSQAKNFTREEFHQFHPGGSLGKKL
ncbi:MAG: SIS domain-containing protein [Candidatus Marinimicrobia bacterium]|nr:SIS domain-containing protein [Candidatus Neomarinimicrobiota bacterium]